MTDFKPGDVVRDKHSGFDYTVCLVVPTADGDSNVQLTDDNGTYWLRGRDLEVVRRPGTFIVGDRVTHRATPGSLGTVVEGPGLSLITGPNVIWVRWEAPDHLANAGGPLRSLPGELRLAAKVADVPTEALATKVLVLPDDVDVFSIPRRGYDLKKGDRRFHDQQKAIDFAQREASRTGVRRLVRIDRSSFNDLYLVQEVGS